MMTPHDEIMSKALAFKAQLKEYLAEFRPHNGLYVDELLCKLTYQMAMMPEEEQT
jgi:hypothetical protein